MTDLTRSSIDIAMPDGSADAYLARPPGDAPGVLVFMDAIGLRPRMEQMADRIAARGYTVLVPNLFYRAGRAPVVPDLVARLQGEDRAAAFAELRPLMAALTPEVAAQDTAAYVEQLPAGPLATVGYCMGGAFALRAAAQLPDRVVAAASFHGGHLAPEDGTGPDLGRVRAEVYAGHADQDQSMPAEQVARFEQALTAAGVRYTSETYPGATHGFTMSDMPVHDAAAEQRHWDALLDLLDRTLR
ncbi:MAG: carboxymethylenebutenolidase [Frankiales bacterium]|nr:carboxymethylenebutenolidase [Frankiales bacterium]